MGLAGPLLWDDGQVPVSDSTTSKYCASGQVNEVPEYKDCDDVDDGHLTKW